MKQAIRSELPEVTQRELEGSRYALLVENKWAPPTVLCCGNDPIVVSQNNTPVELDASGNPKPPHIWHGENPQGRLAVWPDGELYRIDEARRNG
jgi:hypothetical protein